MYNIFNKEDEKNTQKQFKNKTVAKVFNKNSSCWKNKKLDRN